MITLINLWYSNSMQRGRRIYDICSDFVVVVMKLTNTRRRVRRINSPNVAAIGHESPSHLCTSHP
jgi:hypothetical protein